jgi:hypothetical protein
VTLEGVCENFKIHSIAWIDLGLKIRTHQFSARNTKEEFKDNMEYKYWYTSFYRSDWAFERPWHAPENQCHLFIGDTHHIHDSLQIRWQFAMICDILFIDPTGIGNRLSMDQAPHGGDPAVARAARALAPPLPGGGV